MVLLLEYMDINNNTSKIKDKVIIFLYKLDIRDNLGYSKIGFLTS